MSLNTLKIVLSCNGRTLSMGLKEDVDITKITGLESSEIDISTSDNAMLDGETIDGKKIKSRIIHIEAAFRKLDNNPENRQKVIRFFNPKYTGKALITNMGISRNIEYELEGWSFVESPNLNARLKFIVDLKCPDPYMQNVDNFGKNMAAITGMFAFPFRVTKKKVKGLPDKYKGTALGGMIMSYRTLRKEVSLTNDGDVPTGLIIKFVATRGPVKNPKITKVGTADFMRVKVYMSKGDVLVIDTSERHQVIELNGVNCYQKLDRKSNPFLLDIGDNYLSYDTDENYVNLDVNLYYTPKYLGV